MPPENLEERLKVAGEIKGTEHVDANRKGGRPGKGGAKL